MIGADGRQATTLGPLPGHRATLQWLGSEASVNTTTGAGRMGVTGARVPNISAAGTWGVRALA